MASLRCAVGTRCSSAVAQPRPRAVQQLLKQLAHLNPGQLSSYHGARLLVSNLGPARGKKALLAPQGSAATRQTVQMSFFGVGAPEALLVGVVALVVFGPKGLADAARSVGSALRTFQPTIKEVVQVSQELKGSLEKELGLEELREAARPVPLTPTPKSLSELSSLPAAVQAATEETAKAADPDIEAKRAASAQMAWGEPASASGAAPVPAAPVAPMPTASAGPAGKDLGGLSMEELEAELSRRRTAAAGGAKSDGQA